MASPNQAGPRIVETFWPVLRSILEKEEHENQDFNLVCSICYDDTVVCPQSHQAEDGREHHGATVLPCGHIFGKKCISTLFAYNETPSCPTCRTPLQHTTCGHSHPGMAMPHEKSSLSSLPATISEGGKISGKCVECWLHVMIQQLSLKANMYISCTTPRPADTHVGVSVQIAGQRWNPIPHFPEFHKFVAVQDLVMTRFLKELCQYGARKMRQMYATEWMSGDLTGVEFHTYFYQMELPVYIRRIIVTYDYPAVCEDHGNRLNYDVDEDDNSDDDDDDDDDRDGEETDDTEYSDDEEE
ncbi:hypothetical protein FZEAL_6027 [Fusarium zealandicum]|uniref:RING-type domain-containing protein n=1 Tax=Fusarium zealandicum TaxID=1053134 RepID=A0A8H4UIR0_9HYPO|nr:hypothetical protein FZEAL_6027 [Fusarium zealandicum]